MVNLDAYAMAMCFFPTEYIMHDIYPKSNIVLLALLIIVEYLSHVMEGNKIILESLKITL